MADSHTTDCPLPPITKVPLEVLEDIIDHVARYELTNVRLVSSKLYEASMEKFIQSYFAERRHTVSKHSFEELEKVTAHPIFGRHLRVLLIGDAKLFHVGTPHQNTLTKGERIRERKRDVEMSKQYFNFIRSGEADTRLETACRNLSQWRTPVVLGIFPNGFRETLGDLMCGLSRNSRSARNPFLRPIFGEHALAALLPYPRHGKGPVSFRRDADNFYESCPGEAVDMIAKAAKASSLALQGFSFRIGTGGYDRPMVPPKLNEAIYQVVISNPKTTFDMAYEEPYWTECCGRFSPRGKTLEMNFIGIIESGERQNIEWKSWNFGIFHKLMTAVPLRRLCLQDYPLSARKFSHLLRTWKASLQILQMCDVETNHEDWSLLIDVIVESTTVLKQCRLSRLSIRTNKWDRKELMVVDDDVLEGGTVHFTVDVYPNLRLLAQRLRDDERIQEEAQAAALREWEKDEAETRSWEEAENEDLGKE